jgi:outer membrane protein OmpU
MKKILFATSALVATAGFASAEVALSGYAEMGIMGGNEVETQFQNDFDVTFSLSGESDTGLSFGATIDLDEVANGINSRSNPASVWVSGAYGKITIGDTDGAYDWAMIEVARGTAISDDHSSHSGYNGNAEDGSRNFNAYDGQNARYEYSFGDFAVAVSAQLDGSGSGCIDNPLFDPTMAAIGTNTRCLPNSEDAGNNASPYGDPLMSIGGKYNGEFAGGAFGIGAAYSYVNSDNDIWGISGKFDIAGFISNASYSSGTVFGNDITHVGVGLGYQMDALLVQANWGQYDIDNFGEIEGWGLVANYDLGGGAVVMVGYGDGDLESGNGNGSETWSAGVGLSF